MKLPDVNLLLYSLDDSSPHYSRARAWLEGALSWSEPVAFARTMLLAFVVMSVVAFFAILITGRYPRGIFDLVLGMNRWVLRVAGYAGLMTDRYPPFRMDLGEDEPGTMTLPPPAAPSSPGAHAASAAPPRAAPARGGHIVALVLGSLVALMATALLAAGGISLVYDQTQRDSQGFLMSDSKAFSTGTYALVSEEVSPNGDGPDWISTGLLDEVKLRSDSARPVFIGIGPAGAVERYLADVPREQVNDIGDSGQTRLPGSATPAPPGAQRFWVERASGAGVQALRWKVRDGNWRAVVMAADGSRGVDSDLSIGATVPDLGWISGGLLGVGALLLLAGGALIFVGARGLGGERR